MSSHIVRAVTLYLLINAPMALNLHKDRSSWLHLAENDINNVLDNKIIQGTAKNVILFVGDGMGLTTTTASRIYSEQEDGHLSFEQFPNVGVLKTYNADSLVPDSASTATALFSGVKTNSKTSGVDSSVLFGNCEASLDPNARIDGLMKWAQEAGKSTGFVTTTRVTHATPSALYAHVPSRDWECERNVPQDANQCKDIARQLVEDEPGKHINVIMGGGRQCLQSNVTELPGDPIDTWACYSTDGRDLIGDWISDKRNRSKSYAAVANSEELNNVKSDTEFVLGVFANGHMAMDYARDTSPMGMPSLSNMTKKAMEILSTNSEGYILVVEGGLIDFAHHRGHARQALDETVALSNAIKLAAENTNPEETLIVVTSDHSHSLVFTGYIPRGTSILEVAQDSVIDAVPYTALLYGTGGPNNYQYSVVDGNVARADPSTSNTTDFGYSQQAVVLTDEVTHGGTDVLVYAIGPMAHLFHTVHEQTYVAYVVSYSSKIGPFKSGSVSSVMPSILLISLFLAIKLL